MILQLNPTIPLDTPRGLADAHLVIDYGEQQPLLFVCFVRDTGECWVYQQSAILLEKNITMGIRTGDQK